MLDVNTLCVSIEEKEILKNISFSLCKGDTLSIIGPSGCGKSTLLLNLADLKTPTSGNVTDSFKDKGLILQNGGLFPWKTLRDNIALGLLARHVPKEQIYTLTEDIAKVFEINHLLDKYPKDVSGGERQRAAVARILVFKPELILLDEPSSALDSINKEKFQEFLLSIQKLYGLSYIIVTHQIEEAVFLGKKIMVMHAGQVTRLIDNPYFGQESIRKSYDFFNKCNEVRSYLEIEAT